MCVMTSTDVSSVTSVFLLYRFSPLYINAAGHNLSVYTALELKPMLITQNIIRKTLK